VCTICFRIFAQFGENGVSGAGTGRFKLRDLFAVVQELSWNCVNCAELCTSLICTGKVRRFWVGFVVGSMIFAIVRLVCNAVPGNMFDVQSRCRINILRLNFLHKPVLQCI